MPSAAAASPSVPERPPTADGGCGLLRGETTPPPSPSQPGADDTTVPIDGAACEAAIAAAAPLVAALPLARPNEFLRTSRPKELARLSLVPEPGAGVAAVAGVSCSVRVAGTLAAPAVRTSRPKELARLSFLPDAGAAASAGVSCSVRVPGTLAPPPGRPAPFRRLSGLLRDVMVGGSGPHSGSEARSSALRRRCRRTASVRRAASRSL